MTNYTPSYDISIAKTTSQMTGVHDVYSAKVFGTMNHPQHVGLKVVSIKPLEGEFSRVRITGKIDKDIVDTHDNKYMCDEKVLYKAGEYDFITVQDHPEDWSGWF